MSGLNIHRIHHSSRGFVFNSRKNLYLVSLILLLLIFTTALTSSAELDQTSLGVEKGDSFNFIVSKYYVSDDSRDSGYFLFFDADSLVYVTAKEGEEFTITFTDVSLDVRSGNPQEPLLLPFNVRYEISYGNYSFIQTADLRSIGNGFVVLTDWDGHRTNLEEEFDNSNPPPEFEEYITEIIDTDREFGLKYEIFVKTDSKEAITSEIKISFETRYEKESGMLTYQRNYSERTLGDSVIEQEYIIIRKGFIAPELSINALGLPLFVATFVFIAYIKQKLGSNRSDKKLEI